LEIAASPLPLATANGAGYDTSRMVSHRDPSWHPFIYFSDLPNTMSRKYAYADDLAIMLADGRLAGSGSGAQQRHGNRK